MYVDRMHEFFGQNEWKWTKNLQCTHFSVKLEINF